MKEEGKKEKSAEKKVQYFDYSLFTIIIFLLCFGLIMLYSTTASGTQVTNQDSMALFRKQAILAIGCIVGMLLVSLVDYHRYARYAELLYFFAMGLMALVLSPLGKTVYGARRWLRLPGNQSMQPSEVMKVAIVLFISLLICKAGKRIRSYKVVGIILLWGIAAAAGVYFFTDNLSTAVIVLGMVCIMIFVAHPKTAPFVGLAGVGTALLLVFINMLDKMMENSENFRLQRILVWLHPEEYAKGDGFQVMQGLYAIGSGGFFGKGLGNSAQKLIIPEAQNDMILAIICEELGVFGALIMLLMFGVLLYRLMFIAQNAPDMYGSLIATGVFAHIALQVVLNIAVVLGVIPTTGITLPFISSGGTSLIFLMTEMGIALGVSRKIQFQE